MSIQDYFNWSWILLFVTISGLRKYHERKAGKRSSLKETPVIESILMILWGIAAGIIPFFYIFSKWIKFADYSDKMPLVAGVSGIILFLFAIWLLHRSHKDLGKSWDSSLTPKSEKLISEGVYKYIRHPMYSAHIVWGISQALLFPNFISGPLALILIIFTVLFRIPREEKLLLKSFGKEYEEYRKHTGSIFPKFK